MPKTHAKELSLSSSRELPKALLEHPFRFYLKLYRKEFILGVIALFFTNLFDVLPPLIIAQGINQVEAGESSEKILQTTLLLLGSLILTALFRYLWRIYFGRFHHTVADDLRRRVFNHFSQLGPSYYSKKSVGELMSLITNDINSFRMGIGPGFLILFDSLFMSCLTIPIMLSIEPSWTWKTLIFLPMVPFLARLVTKMIFERFKKAQEAFSEMSGVAQEIISGIRVIKSFAIEAVQTERFRQKSKDYEISSNETAWVDSFFNPIMQFGVASGSVILLYYGSPDVIKGAVTLGSFFAFHRYIQRMTWPMSAIAFGVSHYQKGKASFRRIADLLEQEAEIQDDGAIPLKSFESLKVKDLSFSYPGDPTPILSNVSFELKKGQTLGLIGPVGAGKSTLLKLLCRVTPVEKGSISINEKDIENYPVSDLREVIRLIPQDSFLFSESVQDNIGFGRTESVDLSEAEQVARIVRIHKEVTALPGGYQTQLGERGVNLSGGQKQRLAIARGLVSGTELLMFDDSLSAVDAKTEESIKKSLSEDKNYCHSKVFVSHRISTIKDSDLIVVLNAGQVEAKGTHEELLKTSATYQKMAVIQGYTT